MLSFISNAAIEPRRFVKFSSDGSGVETASASGDNIIGISGIQGAEADSAIDVYMPNEDNTDIKIKAGGAFSAGDALTSDEDGCAVQAESGDNIGAIALENALEDEIVRVRISITRAIPAETAQGGGT